MRLPTVLLAFSLGCGAAPPPPPAPPPADETAAPPADRDGDALADESDGCPCEAEDADGVADEDGCPDVDDDADMILDACDRCPGETETWNHHEDDDGCPDEALVFVSDMRIVIVERFTFARNSSELGPDDEALLRALADTITANPQVRLVRLIGHADSGERRPERLAAARADAVFEALVARGVDPARLAVVSRGASDPLAASDTEEGRATNRCVDFEAVFEEPATPDPPPPPPVPFPPAEPICPSGAPPAEPPPC